MECCSEPGFSKVCRLFLPTLLLCPPSASSVTPSSFPQKHFLLSTLLHEHSTQGSCTLQTLTLIAKQWLHVFNKLFLPLFIAGIMSIPYFAVYNAHFLCLNFWGKIKDAHYMWVAPNGGYTLCPRAHYGSNGAKNMVAFPEAKSSPHVLLLLRLLLVLPLPLLK